MNEDWSTLLSFFPEKWEEMAVATNVIKGLRKERDTENYLRTLLLHLACGYSMRETVTRAKWAGFADMSDVAFLGRLQKAKEWLHSLCVAMFAEQGMALNEEDGFEVRLFDATTVKEPGPTGSLWRIHYSVTVPTLSCDFFKLTETKGRGTGESFFQFSIKKGDYIIADRGYGPGIHHVASKKATVMVRVNTQSLIIQTLKGDPFPLLQNVMEIRQAGTVRSWHVQIPGRTSDVVHGRICVIRKTEEAIKMAQTKLRRSAQQKGHWLRPETLEYAKYVIVVTTFPEESFTDIDVLQWYRIRWQVELVFKRFKSIAQLGHLPKHSGESSKAWLYGKLFVALLTEKLIHHASSISPWGYILEEQPASERLA